MMAGSKSMEMHPILSHLRALDHTLYMHMNAVAARSTEGLAVQKYM